MRKRVLWNVPHVRISLAMLLTLIVSLAVAGCGGGGGNSTPPSGTPVVVKGNPALATITGVVTDTTAAATPVAGAIVKVTGTSLQATSGADGKFAIINVPVQNVTLMVVTPSVSTYYSAVVYGANQYDDTTVCPIPVTGLQKSALGPVVLPYPLQLYPAGNNPPFPPKGCPK